MRRYFQPLSEDFVYGSPERPQCGSYRSVTQPLSPSSKPARRQQERAHVDKPKH
jgi:hypothetical protein